MTVPSKKEHRSERNGEEKQVQVPRQEIQRMWHMKTVAIPVVVGALGTEKRRIVEDIKKVSEAHGICANPQKGAWRMKRMIDLSD